MDEVKVLFVDDKPDLLKQAEFYLEKQEERLDVHTFNSAQEAHEKLMEDNFDAVVSDFQMPDIDGLEFLEKVRENGNDIPFIIFTGKSREEVAMDALNLGANRYLQKRRDPRPQYGVLAEAILDEVQHWKDEKDLRKSEEEKRLVLNNTSELIIHQDLDHNIVWANKAAADAFGVEVDELEGEKCYKIWQNIDRPCEDCPIEKAFESGESEGREIVSSDGRIWWIRGNLLFDEDGEVEGVLEVARNITERRKVEMLAEQVIESMEDAILMHDMDGCITSVNPAFENITGYEGEEVLGENIGDFAKEIVSEDDLEKALERLSAILDGNSYSPIVITIESKDGEKFPISLKGSIIENEEGEPVKAFVSGRDISEQKWAEEELKKSETRYRTIFESANDSIIIMDEEEFIDCNQKTLEIFGCSRDEFIGEPPWKFSPPTQPDGRDSKEKALEKINTALEGEPQFFDWVHEKKDGTRFEAEVSLNRYELGGERYVMAIVRDVSERETAEEKFRRLFEAAPDSAFLLDEDGTIEAVNNAVEEVLGLDRTEIIGSNFKDLKDFTPITDESLEKLKKNFEKRMEGEIVEPYTIEFKGADGKTFYSEINAQPIREGGDIVGNVIIARDITKHRRAKEELDKRESELRAVMEGSDDSIYMVDEDCRYVLVNNEHLARLGIGRREEVVGEKFHNFHSEEETKEFENKVKQVFETGESLKQEHKKEDTGKYYLRTFSPLMDSETGEVLNVSVVSKDITERKKMEKRLREAKEKYEELFEGANELVVITDREGQIKRINRKTSEVSGYSEKELKGQSVLKFAHPEDREEYIEFWEEILEGEEVTKTIRGVDKGGNVFWLKAGGRPVREDGEIVELQYSAQDITERKRAEEALKESEQRFRSVVENSHDGILIANDDYEFVYVNDRFCEILGYSEEELIGEDFRQFMDKESRELVADRYKRRQRGEEIPPRYEFNVIRKDGEKRVVEISSTTIEKSEGETFTVAQILDITESKRRKEREEFLHSLLRHDVKNKIQIIRNSLALLEDTDLSEEQEEFVDMAIKSCRKGHGLIEKVRTLRDLEDEEAKEMSLGPIINRVISEKEPSLSSEVIKLEQDVKNVDVLAGPLLEEVFSNLIDNAVQHADCDTIRISTEVSEGKCSISVADDGQGVDDDIKDVLFDRGFTRGESSGSGLGTYLVKEIVEGYGGEVEIKDSSSGGAKFIVTLERT